jgi:hypothetical protein
MPYAIARLQGVQDEALLTYLFLGVAAATAALAILIGGVYAWGRLTMRRLAKQHGVEAGPGVSSYKQSLVLSIDPPAALSHGRAAVLALPREVDLEGESAALDEVVGHVGGSERSFGEIVRVRVRRTTAGRSAIEVQSRPLNWQLFDGGINAENVAEIVRQLEVRGALVQKGVDKPSPSQETQLTAWDWLALAYLILVACYTSLLIAAKMLWPDTFAVWAGWLNTVPLDPLLLLGHACPTGDPATKASVIPQLNLLILPTIVVYSAYNASEFRNQRDRMNALNWLFCISSLVILPLLVLNACSADWIADLTPKYRLLISFMVEDSAGGAIYALLLIIFTNGVSYLPALLLSRIFKKQTK